MTMRSPLDSLAGVQALLSQNHKAKNLLRKFLVKSYEEFVEVLYEEIDIVISKIERNPQFYYDDEEDKITHHIVTSLQDRNYDAEQGAAGGGSVDITVSGKEDLWSWIGEAKIYRSLKDLQEGYAQLTTRYRTASPNFNCRGMLVYIQRKDAAKLMKEWGEDLAKMGLDDYGRSNCSKRPMLAFFTTQKDASSGTPMLIRHNGICLYHIPEDKSGRNATKHITRRKAAAQTI